MRTVDANHRLEAAVSTIVDELTPEIEDVESETTYSSRQAQVVVFRRAGLDNAAIALLTALHSRAGDREGLIDIKYYAEKYREEVGEGDLNNSITPGTVANYYTDAKAKYEASRRAVEEGEALFGDRDGEAKEIDGEE